MRALSPAGRPNSRRARVTSLRWTRKGALVVSLWVAVCVLSWGAQSLIGPYGPFTPVTIVVGFLLKLLSVGAPIGLIVYLVMRFRR